MTSHESAKQIQQVCDAFKLAWSNGERPEIDDFGLRVDAASRHSLIEKLILIDIAFRQQAGESISENDYRSLKADLAGWFTEGPHDRQAGDDAPVTLTQPHQSEFEGTAHRAEHEWTTDSGKPKSEIDTFRDISVGQRFGDYLLMEEIARGGMGVVYKAEQTKLKRIVALKMILAGSFASEDEIRRFYAEAESAARLEHPGIVPIYEVGRVGQQHFFSMAFVEGCSLATVVQPGPLTPRRAADYAGQISAAIAYAHEHNVIHRDLKPANVLLDENDRVKVTDFGLAKQLELDTGLTATGQIMGTPGFMPPEQASGKISQVDQTSDVYSIGAILYCLLSGRAPFQAATPMETLAQVMDQDPVSPRTLVPGIPRDLETICLKCLNKEKYRRYASARELADEIHRFEQGQPITARRVSGVERAVRWLRRRSQPLQVAAFTGLAVVICIAAGLLGYFAYQQSILGYVDLGTREEEGYLVATIYDDDQRQIERQTLPTQEPIALPEGRYRVRLSGARRMSKDIQLEVQRGSRRQPYSPELSLQDTELWPTFQYDGQIEFSQIWPTQRSDCVQ